MLRRLEAVLDAPHCNSPPPSSILRLYRVCSRQFLFCSQFLCPFCTSPSISIFQARLMHSAVCYFSRRSSSATSSNYLAITCNAMSVLLHPLLKFLLVGSVVKTLNFQSLQFVLFFMCTVGVASKLPLCRKFNHVLSMRSITTSTAARMSWHQNQSQPGCHVHVRGMSVPSAAARAVCSACIALITSAFIFDSQYPTGCCPHAASQCTPATFSHLFAWPSCRLRVSF